MDVWKKLKLTKASNLTCFYGSYINVNWYNSKIRPTTWRNVNKRIPTIPDIYTPWRPMTTCGDSINKSVADQHLPRTRRSPFCDFHIWYSHILTWTFLLFTFLLWHSLSSTYFCCTQLSFSQFSPGITQLNLVWLYIILLYILQPRRNLQFI